MKDYSMCIDKKIIDNASLYKEVCDSLIADDFINENDCCETYLNIRLKTIITALINNDAETIPLLDRELIQMIDKYDDPEEFKQAYLKRTDPNEPNPYAGIVFPFTNDELLNRKVAKRFEETIQKTHTTTQT